MDLERREARGFVSAGLSRAPHAIGTCEFDKFIWIFSPKATNTYFNLFGQGFNMLAAVKEIRDQ